MMVTPRLSSSERLADLCEMWRLGRRDEVESTLAASSEIASRRLVLEALGHAKSFERAGRLQLPNYRSVEQFIILNSLVDFGHIEAARAFVTATTAPKYMPEGLANLRTLLGNRPDWPSGATLVDKPSDDVQIVPAPSSQCVLFVFTGIGHGFHGALAAVHPWFQRLGVTIVYLRDFHQMFYLAGIRSLGDGCRAAVDGLRRIAASLGARWISCVGASGGCYGAMRLGLDVGASKVLCIAGPSMIDESLPDILERERRRGPVAEPINPEQLNLAVLYAKASRTPRVRLIFGADNTHDRQEAENMANLPSVELLPLRGVWQHAILPYLVRDGALDRHLKWLVTHAPEGHDGSVTRSPGKAG